MSSINRSFNDREKLQNTHTHTDNEGYSDTLGEGLGHLNVAADLI